MRPRIAEELALLRKQYSDVEHKEADTDDWFLLPTYPAPPGWRIAGADVSVMRIVFLVTAAYPVAKPYAFVVPEALRFGDTIPANSGNPSKTPPFEGSWRQLSWDCENWTPDADVGKGSNLASWVRSFSKRLREGT